MITGRQANIIQVGMDHLIKVVEADTTPDLELIQDFKDIKAIFNKKGDK